MEEQTVPAAPAEAPPPPGGSPDPAKKFEDGPVKLTVGTLVGAQWKVLKKLGEGGCGAVYLVESATDGKKAALKAESNFVEGGSVLKLEVDILGKLKGKKHVCELLGCGRKDEFQYIVMSLLGPSLCDMIKICENEVTVSTQLRVGVHVLHGLKQIHDTGFVHRDVKPANLAMGNPQGGTDANFIYVLDFGLSRSFVREENGKKAMRKPRRSALFRGTTRYCSADANLKHDQSRVDDLWSLLYVMVELRTALPWANLTERDQLAEAKKKVDERELFADSPCQLRDMASYLRTLTYFTRPDYLKIYTMLMDGMRDGGYKFSDPWDWQVRKINTQKRQMAEWEATRAAKGKTTTKSKGRTSVKGAAKKFKVSLKSLKKTQRSENKSTPESSPASDPPPKFEPIVFPDATPFTEEDFSTDPLGF